MNENVPELAKDAPKTFEFKISGKVFKESEDEIDKKSN